MKLSLYKLFIWVTIYSLAMAFLESAVVVYIREIYYPEGFDFPLKLIDSHIAVTELIREAATIIMLIAISFLAGRTAYERFAWFIFSFAIWDIFYYVFLKFLIDWPAGLLEWDVLFLLPFTWVGPVIGPVINSLMMIALSVIIIQIEKKKEIIFQGFVWVLLILGSIIVISAYTEDYVGYMLKQMSFFELLNPANSEEIFKYALNYIPDSFNYLIYFIGIGMHGYAILHLFYKNRKNV